MSRRVVFTFDDRSYAVLKSLQAEGDHETPAEAVRIALLIARGLQGQAEQGFTQVLVRNPETDEQRLLVLERKTRLVARTPET